MEIKIMIEVLKERLQACTNEYFQGQTADVEQVINNAVASFDMEKAVTEQVHAFMKNVVANAVKNSLHWDADLRQKLYAIIQEPVRQAMNEALNEKLEMGILFNDR